MSRYRTTRAYVRAPGHSGRFAILTCLLLSACAAPRVEIIETVHVPEGTVDTTNREITLQQHQDFYLPELGLWVSNRFAGARMNSAAPGPDGSLVIDVRPENSPINDSPWYGFRLWRDSGERPVDIVLRYTGGNHRYPPKISNDGKNWRTIDPDAVTATAAGEARFSLDVGTTPLWVAAQEVVTGETIDTWLHGLARQGCARLSRGGFSTQGAPIPKAAIGTPGRPAVVVLGRQHPPEVTGVLALFSFIETVCDDSDLAKRFRDNFAVVVYPLMNPDGVREGHWRHNINGVDTNRDWQHFRQPEPRAIRDDLLATDLVDVVFALDFHSTQKDIFYVLEESEGPEDYRLMIEWITAIADRVEGYHCLVQPVSSKVPGSSVWMGEALDTPSATYEVGDDTPRERIHTVATAAAQAMMELLLRDRSD